MSTTTKNPGGTVIKSAFGAVNRNRLIDKYLDDDKYGMSGANAWKHVYRLLLWVDQTIGLAHCYESDKCQPGKNWYARSLAFHDWVSTSLGTSPGKIGDEIDWLFRRATDDLAKEVLQKAARVEQAARRQRKGYDGRGFPKPGEDPELISIVKNTLGDHLTSEPSTEEWNVWFQQKEGQCNEYDKLNFDITTQDYRTQSHGGSGGNGGGRYDPDICLWIP